MTFIVITGPTNAGKTTYSKTLARDKCLVFSFDEYYQKERNQRRVFDRYKKSSENLLRDAVAAYKSGTSVVCEGSQFLIPELFSSIASKLDKAGIEPRFIFLNPHLSQIYRNFKKRNSGRNLSNRLILEKLALTVLSYLFFKKQKGSILSTMDACNRKYVFMERVANGRTKSPEFAYA